MAKAINKKEIERVNKAVDSIIKATVSGSTKKKATPVKKAAKKK